MIFISALEIAFVAMVIAAIIVAIVRDAKNWRNKK